MGTDVEKWILEQEHQGLYQVKNIRKNPNEDIWYDMWILTVASLDGSMDDYFENMQLSRAAKDLSEKCCYEDVSGNFYYGEYGNDYNQNVIARRVIEHSPNDGLRYVIDEVFNFNDPRAPSNDSEEIWRKVNGPESA